MADLAVRNLALRLGDAEILQGVSLTVAAGEAVALLGASGSGKTTLLRAIAGLERPHAGSIVIGERVLFDAERGIDLPAEQRGLGLVFQSYALWPHRTVFENVATGLKLRDVTPDEITQRVDRVLAQFDLSAFAARLPAQLSGGQQQRVAIARALVYEPPVILLDEPLSNLDARLREEARGWLRLLITTLGLSAIHVTHDQAEAMAIADRIVLLDAGRIAQDGSPSALYREPASRFAAEFMGSNNRLDGVLLESANGRATLEVLGEPLIGLARTSAQKGATVAGIIRVERTRLAREPGRNRLAMTLKTAMYLGERWELWFERGHLSARAYAEAPPTAGEHYVEFPPEALWVF
ncbi:MAG TPA: ABC transporter ATP-binding protein [Pseudolabrys sp.]|nr:ABC transporter ATP-binding protein [Pseudolabrys sp.]